MIPTIILAMILEIILEMANKINRPACNFFLITCNFFLIVCVIGLFFCSGIYAENLNAKNLNAGVVLADDQGNILYGQNREKPFIPASILKIFTSLSALNILGPDFHFSTDYYVDPDSKNLYLKGFGDPLLISEVIETLCLEIISKAKPGQIQDIDTDIANYINNYIVRDIILDHTYFSDQIQVPGKGRSLNPYDAPVGALSANFNTILFQWDKGKKRFASGESQTPLLPDFLGEIKKTGLKQGRIVLSKQQSLIYPGLLVKFFLEKNHIAVTGSARLGKFEEEKGVKNTFFSPFDIKQVVQKLLKYSNNYMANLVFLAMGAKTYGPPATLEKGVKAVKMFSKQRLGFDDFVLAEGSGLSRSNRISCDQMLKVLIEFMPFHGLLKKKDNDFFKTGTLSGIRTRAGYISGKDGRLYPYVIMVNQKNKGYDAILKKLIRMVQ